MDISNTKFFFVVVFVFPMASPLSHSLWPTTKTRSGDHFITDAPDRLSPLPPMKRRTVFTSMPYPGF